MQQKTKVRSRKSQKTNSSVLLGLAAIVAGVALVGLGLTWFLSGSGSVVTGSNSMFNGPRIALDEDYFDFGNMQFEQWARREFRFRNIGNQPLVLQGKPNVEAVEGC